MENTNFQDLIKEMEERIIGAISTKLDSKFEETLQKINSKVTNNESAITELKDTQNELNDKVINITARLDFDTEQTADNTERLDKIDREMKCYELRLKET